MSEASSVLTDDRSNTSVIPKDNSYVAPVLGKWRKVLLLSLFCFAEYLPFILFGIRCEMLTYFLQIHGCLYC